MLTTIIKEGGRTLARALVRTISDVMFGSRMSRAEAKMILNVSSESEDEVRAVFLRMHKANSRENNGSPYLQSKVLNAYTLLSDSENRAKMSR